MPANVLGLSSDRWQELRSHNKNEARYHAQRQAISKALERHGRQMLKRNNKPIFRVRETDLEIHYLSNGDWWCGDREIQQLINQAIANL